MNCTQYLNRPMNESTELVHLFKEISEESSNDCFLVGSQTIRSVKANVYRKYIEDKKTKRV